MIETFKKEYINKIINGESVNIMKKMPDNSIDFCFADPPYFMQLDKKKKLYRADGSKFNGINDSWDEFSSMDEYKNFTFNWLKEVKRLLKDDGLICVISSMQSIHEIGTILKDLGFWTINDIIWEKSNPTPNFMGTRLTNSHETLIVAAKSKKSKFTFNYKTAKILNGGKQMGSIWKIPVCSGNERLKDEFGNKLHNTQKPEELLYRLLVIFTKKGDLILDPFAGTMTSGAIAKKTGRNYILIEQDIKYIKYGEERINKETQKIGLIEDSFYDIKPKNVKWKDLVNNGYYKIGEEFFHKNGKIAYLANDSGYLKYNDSLNSLHDIAALMMDKKRRVNGFNYFFVKRNDKLVSINEIRNNFRNSLKNIKVE